jgi:ketosteroid isomerase-like protein
MASRNLETYLGLTRRTNLGADLTSKSTEDATLAVMTADIEVHEPGCLPQGGVHKGKDAFVELHHTMRALWEQKAEILHVWDAPEDDVVVVYSNMEWTAKATGKKIRFPAVNVLHFRDGLICKAEVFHQDPKAVLETLTPSEEVGDER